MTANANLLQNLQNVPSVFEITAAETLDGLIYPALNKVFDYFGLSLDFKLWSKVHIHEEIAPIITWILQYTYLRNRAASFGESFYGLQRTLTTTGALPTHRQQLVSATLLTLIPYVERKLQTRRQQHEIGSRWEHLLLRAFYTYKAARSIHLFLYLIKYSLNHTPIFRLLGLTLRYPAMAENSDNKRDIFLKLLEFFAFFLQFMQWWYSNDNRRKVGGALQTPVAPKPNAELMQQLKLTKGHCPICLMRLQTPTACAISGYVFCWKCIIAHLKRQQNCPVTGYACSIEDLVRVYETAN